MLNINNYNKAVLNGTMYDVLSENAESFMERNAIEYFGNRYTYRRLFDDIEKAARALAACGMKLGDRAALALITTPETMALAYACSKLGIATIMLDVRYKVEEIAQICRDTDTKMLFIMDWNEKELKSIQKIVPELKTVVISPVESMPSFARAGRQMGHFFQGNILVDNEQMFGWKRFISLGQEFAGAIVPCHSGEIEVYFSTSGTTGKRKLVTLSNRKLNMAVSQHFIPEFDLDKDRTFLSVMPLFACYGWVTSVHLPLTVGMKVIIYPIYNCRKIPQIIAKKKPNYFAGVPAFYESMLTSKYMKDTDLSFIKGLISGGESMSAEKETAVNEFLEERGCYCRIRQGYGMTELSAGAFIQYDEDYAPGSVGKVFGLTEVKILDNGEICIHTPVQMSGYLNEPEGTAEVIRVHEDGKEWIHTGDIGHFDENGNLVIEGRIKKMLVTENGTKIFPNMIENKIMNLDCVGDCAVVPMKKENGTCIDRLKIYVVPGSRVPAIMIRNSICRSLETEHYRFIVAGDIEIINEMPVTGFGKHDYQKLQAMAA